MSFMFPSRTRSRTPSRTNLNNYDMPISTPMSAKIGQLSGFKSWLKSSSENSFCCVEIPIIHPFGPFRLIWDLIVICILLYTSIETDTLAFGVVVTLDKPFGILALLIDLFLLIDIMINFMTAYIDRYDHLHIITSHKQIAKRYVKSWFFLDFLTSLPLEFVVPLFYPSDQDEDITEIIKLLRIFRLLRGLKMLRVLRIFKLVRGLKINIAVTREAAIGLKCIRCLIAMLLTAHYFACFWYFIGWFTSKNGKQSWLQIIDENHENASNFTKYSYSWYWAIVTLFTTGYGDIHAFNEEEQWTASICILIGTCFFAYFIGVLTTLLEEGDRVRQYELERVEEAQLFCEHYRLSKPLSRAITTHLRYFCNYNYVFDQQRIMQSIPKHLQNHITQHLAKSLCHLDFMSQLPLSVVGQIALRMNSLSCNSGHTLFKKGELAQEFFIQRTGKSVLYKNRNSNYLSKRRILERGDVCGEYVILSGKHRDTVKCLTWSEFYVIDISDLLDILRDNFLDKKALNKHYRHIKTILRKTLRRATRRKVEFEAITKGDNDYIHELSHHDEPNFLNRQSRTNSPIKKHHGMLFSEFDVSAAAFSPRSCAAQRISKQRPKIPDPTAFNFPQRAQTNPVFCTNKLGKKQQPKTKYSHSDNIFSKFSFLTRENSVKRDEFVVKKPYRNALSMDVGKLCAANYEFEYSDHEDSHFFSDIGRCDHDILSIGTNSKRYKGNSSQKSGSKRMGKFGKKRGVKSAMTNSKSGKYTLMTNGFGEELVKEMYLDQMITTHSSSDSVENEETVREITQVTEWNAMEKDDGYDIDGYDEEENEDANDVIVSKLKRPKSAILTVPPIVIPTNQKMKNVVIEMSKRRKRSLSMPKNLKINFGQTMDVTSPLNVIKSDEVMDGVPLKYTMIDHDSDNSVVEIAGIQTNETDHFVVTPYEEINHVHNIANY